MIEEEHSKGEAGDLLSVMQSASVEIAVLVKSLAFYDDDSSAIQNKYGTIDRSQTNQKKRRRLGGIEFNNLAIFDCLSWNSELIKNNVEQLVRDLFVIREKIKIIIQSQVNAETAEITSLGTSLFLVNVTSYCYLQILMQHLQAIASDDLLTSLDFSKKEDRYCFGNFLLMIGENSRDVKELSGYDDNAGLFNFFKSIRDKRVAHDLRVMCDEFTVKQKEAFDLIRKLLVNFDKSLDEVSIAEPSDFNNIYCVYLGSLSEKQRQELNKLMSNAFEGSCYHLTLSKASLMELDRIIFNQSLDMSGIDVV